MIDVELKNERKADGGICFCGEPAVRIVTVGETHNHYGDDYSICEMPECLDEALANEIEEIDYIRSHRREFSNEERWNMRDGK